MNTRRRGVGRSRVRWVWTSLLGLAVLASAGPEAAAQERRGPPPGRQGLQEQIRERFGALVRRELGLDEDAQAALSGVLRRFDEQRRTLRRDGADLQRRLGGLSLPDVVRGESPPLLEEDEARELLDRMIEFRTREAELFRAEQEALLEVLTPAQLVRFHALREAMAERIRSVRGPGPRGPGGPGGGGPPRR